MTKFKVYSLNLDGVHRGIVAAPNLKVAAACLKVSLYYLRLHGSETGNHEEIQQAMEEPYVAWKRKDFTKDKWVKIQ